MKALIATVIFASELCLCAAEPVMIPNAASPNGTFSIRLTHDRAKETDPVDDDAPDVQIVVTGNNKVLVAFPFAADPNSDMQPLRTKVRANWNADGTAVALSFSERFYTHLLVYRLQGTFAAPEAFVPVTLPDTVPVIRAMIPRFKEFRSRWHSNFQGWPGRNTIQFSAGTGALITPIGDGDPSVMAVYSFTVDITDTKTPIIKRVERINEDDY
jgi:hypothetical protein